MHAYARSENIYNIYQRDSTEDGEDDGGVVPCVVAVEFVRTDAWIAGFYCTFVVIVLLGVADKYKIEESRNQQQHCHQ